MSNVRMLGRLAKRYALRHKGQTIRALLGLLVATTVLTVGLGLGESIATSLEDEALRRFGPIDIIVRSAQPFPASFAERLSAASDAEGAATFNLVGSVVDTDTDLAEAFATVRGVSAKERETLGALRTPEGEPLAEPRTGEVVLSEDLATRLHAKVGHAVRIRAAPPGFEPNVSLQPAPLVGATGLPDAAQPRHNVTIREGALGLGAQVMWQTDAGEVTLTARSPGGIEFANKSSTSPLQLIVEGPLEQGEWLLRVGSVRPTVYTGGTAVVYLPSSLDDATVVLDVRVSGIARDEGRTAITGRPAALLSLAQLQDAFGQRGNVTHAYFHASGDPHAAVRAMRGVLPDGETFNVTAEKADAIANARRAGADITGFLLGMGGFTLLAAVLLAFTLFSALVEERRSELGIMRALGVTRGEVAAAMTMEGALYAFAAAVAGLALGLVVLVVGVTMLGQVSANNNGPVFAFHVAPATLVIALVVGAGLPLATIALGSFRFARLDPARAIRGIPDDPRSGRRMGTVLALAILALGLLLSLSGLLWASGLVARSGPTPVAWLVGVPIVIAGLAALAWSLRRPLIGAGLALVALVVTLVTLYTWTEFPEEQGELDPITTLGRAAVLALGGAALAVASAKPYQRIAAWFARGRAKRPAFVAFRYLVARRRPAGLTMAMIAVVVVIVTVMGTLFSVFSATIPDEEAGYSVIGESPLPLERFPRELPADLAPRIERADFLLRHTSFRQADVAVNGRAIDPDWGFRQFVSVTEDFARFNEYELRERASRYPTDDDAWLAAARGEAMMVPHWVADDFDIHAGDRITLNDPVAGSKDYVVAATFRSQFASATGIAKEDVRAMGFPTSSQVFIRVVEGEDPNELAHRLTALYAEDGITFTSIPEEVQTVGAQIQALVLVFEAFLALGLFVGLAATGFLASRAVHERIRDIGTLRAMGFEESDVRRAFMLESTLTAGIGLAIGTLVGLVVAGSVWWREVRDEGYGFRPPWLLMLGFSIAVLGLAALASRGPAKRAARLAPAIAVRYVE